MNQSAEQLLAPELGPGGAVSALADCALDRSQAEIAIDRLLASSELRRAWDELHWVGDCMRSDEFGALPDGAAFMARFQAQLADEPTILAPQAMAATAPMRWLRYGVPAIAAAVVLSSAVWVMAPTGNGAQVAQENTTLQPVSAQATAVPGRVVKEVDPAQLNEYLAAHQEFASTALHGPGAIQAASFQIVADGGRDHP